MRKRIKELEARRLKLQQGGGPKEIERQHKRGKLTARERVNAFVDKDSFRESELWAKARKTGFDIDDRDFPGDGVITGSGKAFCAGGDVLELLPKLAEMGVEEVAGVLEVFFGGGFRRRYPLKRFIQQEQRPAELCHRCLRWE